MIWGKIRYSRSVTTSPPIKTVPPWSQPQWLKSSKLWQRQFLRPPSYGCSWCARASGCRQYKYNDDLSEGLPVINDTTSLSEGLLVIDDTSTITIWVKDCQLSMIRQKRPEWGVASYRRYKYYDNLSKGLSVINDTSTKITYEVNNNLYSRWSVWSPSNSIHPWPRW